MLKPKVLNVRDAVLSYHNLDHVGVCVADCVVEKQNNQKSFWVIRVEFNLLTARMADTNPGVLGSMGDSLFNENKSVIAFATREQKLDQPTC